jgi:hypothetical protein
VRIEVMKVHHWASEWPDDYLSAYDMEPVHYGCMKGHQGCSMIEEGPCLDDVGRNDYAPVREHEHL